METDLQVRQGKGAKYQAFAQDLLFSFRHPEPFRLIYCHFPRPTQKACSRDIFPIFHFQPQFFILYFYEREENLLCCVPLLVISFDSYLIRPGIPFRTSGAFAFLLKTGLLFLILHTMNSYWGI